VLSIPFLLLAQKRCVQLQTKQIMITKLINKIKTIQLMLLGILVISLGIAFYFIFNRNILLFKFLNIPSTKSIPISLFLKSYFCDITYSIYTTFMTIFFMNKDVNKILLNIFLILGPTYEILQFINPTLGTFDIIDLLILSFPIFIMSSKTQNI
jgi:hypothetical protein